LQAETKKTKTIKGFLGGTAPALSTHRTRQQEPERRELKQEDHPMKKLSTIAILAAAATFALTTASFSGPVPNTNQNTKAADAQTIAQLQEAAQQALADGRNGGKNNPEYRRKNYEINLLIDRLQSGQQVDPSEIDKAMEPVHIW
jgi:hypothetical protein